jgi:hypothetical protein
MLLEMSKKQILIILCFDDNRVAGNIIFNAIYIRRVLLAIPTHPV